MSKGDAPRIITGTAKGKRLHVSASNPELRPVLDRIKTAIFNALGPEFRFPRVLDLFAGCGSLGLEAASRGAELVVMVENDKRTVEALRRNAAETELSDRVEIVEQDVLRFLTNDTRQYDLLFIDPPFSWSREGRTGALMEKAASRLAQYGLGILRVPAEDRGNLSIDGFVSKTRKYGKSQVVFIKREMS